MLFSIYNQLQYYLIQDMINRRYAMTLLMDIAKQQGERQFILLTPLDMRYGTVLDLEAADKILVSIKNNLILINFCQRT